MKIKTLCFLIEGEKILLGLKKTGFGAGKYNGYGGEAKKKETCEQAVTRELYEEIGVYIHQSNLEKVSIINFYFSAKPEWNQQVHAYFTKNWVGSPFDKEHKMSPEWIDKKSIPYNNMWAADKIWIPKILQNKKIKMNFTYGTDNNSVKEYEMIEVEKF